jgi:hypothetical protein
VVAADRSWWQPIARGGSRSLVTGDREKMSNGFYTVNVAVLSPPAQPVTVTLPMPEIIKERYLEIRGVDTKEVVTTIEILSRSQPF